MTTKKPKAYEDVVNKWKDNGLYTNVCLLNAIVMNVIGGIPLPPREKAILIFLLNGATRTEVGAQFNVTMGRIRQIEEKILYRIKHYYQSNAGERDELQRLRIELNVKRRNEPESYTPIEVINLSPRTLNALINAGVGSIEQLVKCSSSTLSNFRGCGTKAIDEISVALATRNLKLAL